METWMVVILIVAYLAMGIMFAAPRYEKKLDELEQKLQRARPDEKLYFSDGKVLRWCLLVAVAWWFAFPYEWFTRWRQWTYPYCLPGGAPKGWDEEPTIKIRPRAHTVAALQVSGKTIAKEVNEQAGELESAEKVSPEFLKQRVTI